MRLICTSDLHGFLPQVPECDLLLIAGDTTPARGPAAIDPGGFRLDPAGSVDRQMEWIESDFRPWIEAVPARETVLIAGNHDFCMQTDEWRDFSQGLPVHYLEDSGVEIDGLKIWGMPWVSGLRGWAFTRDEPGMAENCRVIPADIDILVSHGPPRGMLDDVRAAAPLDEHFRKPAPHHVGSEALARRLPWISPSLFVCGHIHEDHGLIRAGDSVLANVACMDVFYDTDHPQAMLRVEIEESTGGLIVLPEWIRSRPA
jgi:Icc-related predicted phosphoesterase